MQRQQRVTNRAVILRGAAMFCCVLICALIWALPASAADDDRGGKTEVRPDEKSDPKVTALKNDEYEAARRLIEIDPAFARVQAEDADDGGEAAYQRIEELLLQIDETPGFSERTRKVLRGQVETGFAQFDYADGKYPPLKKVGNVVPKLIGDVQFGLEAIFMTGNFGWSVWEDCFGAAPCEFPEEYDAMVERIYLVWGLASAADRTKIEEHSNGQNGKSLRLFLQGQQQIQGFDLLDPKDFRVYTSATGCGVGGATPCMVTVIEQQAWYPGLPPWPAWTVQVELWKLEPLAIPIAQIDQYGNLTTITSAPVLQGSRTGNIVPPSPLKSYWTVTIGASTMSPRCTTCHAMDTPLKVVDQHAYIPGVPFPTEIQSVIDPNKSVLHCQNCHEGYSYLGATSNFPESIWATPTVALDIDWLEIIGQNVNTWPTEICNRMVNHLPSHTKREQHFHDDARLFWAVAKGEVPGEPDKPTASPHNYQDFLDRFDIWNDSGAICP